MLGFFTIFGNPPPWQVEQPVVIPVWFIVAGTKLVVLVWQVSQLFVVGKCAADLPSAFVPLWQLAQPVVMPVWFIAAPPLKLVVLLWQVSHAADVTIWVLGFFTIFGNPPP